MCIRDRLELLASRLSVDFNWVLAAMETMPEAYVYVGDDCRPAFAARCGLDAASQQHAVRARLKEALGLDGTADAAMAARATDEQWSDDSIWEAVRLLLLPAGIESPQESPVTQYLQSAWRARPHDTGDASHAAMPMRLRHQGGATPPAPALPFCCELCEAQFATERRFEEHVNCVHGGEQRYRDAWLALEEQQPHVVSPQEMRRVVEAMAECYHHATVLPQAAPEAARLPLAEQQEALWQRLTTAAGAQQSPAPEPAPYEPSSAAAAQAFAERKAPRRFRACVVCALLHWSEELQAVYLAGEHCFMSNPAAVARLLSAAWYAECWPRIPWPELEASAVDLPHPDPDSPEEMTSTKVLLHKRRIPESALEGQESVCACALCVDALRGKKPRMPKYTLANFLWLGRHHPLLREASLGHQLLLALGRVVSTKVYLSSKGREESAPAAHFPHCLLYTSPSPRDRG